jgi:4-amino-4-deoxy-L-arabinose transferase-like glycosyltransferase
VTRLFIVAVICRLLFVVWLNFAPAEYRPSFAVVTPDSKGYLQLAFNLMQGEGYHFGGDHMEPTRIPPLFSFWLALVGHLSLHPAAVGLVNALLGGVTTVLLYRLGLLTIGRRAAIIGATLYAVLPHVLLTSTRVLKEPLSVLLLVAFTLTWTKALGAAQQLSRQEVQWSALTGLLLGLSILSRYLHLGLLCMVLAVYLVLFIAGARLRVSRAAIAVSALLIVLSAVFTIAPWLHRNYMVTGEVVISTHGPMRYLYNSNSALARPETWGYYEAKTARGAEWDEKARALAQKLGSDVPEEDPDHLLHPAIVNEDDSPTQRERKFAKAAIISTTSDPAHVLSLIKGKLINTWRPVWKGSSKLTWLAIGIPHILLMVLSLLGAGFTLWRWKSDPQPERLVPLTLVLFYLLAHAVFYGMIRSRLYPIPFLCLLAAVCIDRQMSRGTNSTDQNAPS